MNNQDTRFANQYAIQWFPGHMAKTLRMMEQEIQHVDASLVLLDARIPLSSLNPEIERITARKPKLYALNKADLADPAVTEEWIRYFHEADAGCVAISAKQKGGANAVRAAIEKELSGLLARRQNRGMAGAKTQVMLCGIPNVGKSTFINTFANANTIFIGMPLNLALFGPQGESAFLAYYVLNTLSTWAFGSFLITGDPTEAGSLQERNPKSTLKQVLSPPLLAFFAALLLILGNVGIPVAVLTTTQYLGSLVTPLALLYIGIVLYHAGLASLRMDRDTALALVGKFAVAPFAMILVLMAAAQGGVTLDATEKGTFIIAVRRSRTYGPARPCP